MTRPFPFDAWLATGIGTMPVTVDKERMRDGARELRVCRLGCTSKRWVSAALVLPTRAEALELYRAAKRAARDDRTTGRVLEDLRQ